MKTKIHFYRIDASTTEGQREYADLRNRIEANHPEARGNWHNVITPKYTPHPEETTQEIEIETAHLFDNQWNTTDGRRVFDWFEEYARNPDIRKGHWVEITKEMAEARKQTHKCGYCGKQYGPYHTEKTGDFCTACLDSPYLKEDELYLLRLMPLAGSQKRGPLKTAERDALLPVYVERQTIAADSRAVQKRERQRCGVEEKYRHKTESAETFRAGMLWLHDQGFDLENVIYYAHTGRFCFGWRRPVCETVKSRILDIISEFPYPYEIKTQDGRKLEG